MSERCQADATGGIKAASLKNDLPLFPKGQVIFYLGGYAHVGLTPAARSYRKLEPGLCSLQAPEKPHPTPLVLKGYGETFVTKSFPMLCDKATHERHE